MFFYIGTLELSEHRQITASEYISRECKRDKEMKRPTFLCQKSGAIRVLPNQLGYNSEYKLAETYTKRQGAFVGFPNSPRCHLELKRKLMLLF